MHKHNRALVALLAICAALMSFGGAVSAESATATPVADGNGYPVAIHQGTCASPTAEPAWKVSTTSGIVADDNAIVGTPAGATVYEASASINAKLDDLGKQPYVIALHASADDYGTLVACGSIAGPKKDGKLVVALEPVDGSKVSGIAIFDEDKSGVLGLGGDKVQVTVYVSDGRGPSSTPAA